MARRCGVPDVWALTQRQWYRELLTWKERQEGVVNRESTHAWMIAKLGRAKKIPALKKLLVGEAATSKPQTVETHRQMLHQLSAQYGTALRPPAKKVTRG